MFIFEKVWNKFKQTFHGCKNISLPSFVSTLLTKYLGTLLNYNLISNCCQFHLTFIKRTRVLVDNNDV